MLLLWSPFCVVLSSSNRQDDSKTNIKREKRRIYILSTYEKE
jgi:hypothetical protein